MNILIVASKFPPEYSGPGVRIPRLYKVIREDIGAEQIEVICNGIEQSKNETYEYEGFPVQRRVAQMVRQNIFPLNLLPQRFKNTIAYLSETVQMLFMLKNYEGKVDLVHILGHSGATASALRWAKKNDIPVLIELVTASAKPEQKFMQFWNAKPPKNCGIIALTKRAEERCKKLGYTDAQIWQRPNPINEALYCLPSAQEKQDLRAELSPFNADDTVIASVAKMMPQKNQLLLVKTMPHLPEHFKLLIAGPSVTQGNLLERDKQYMDAIRTVVEEHNLQDRVHMVLDFVKSDSYMKAADLYALPAWDEGFGTPMIEAIACGLPVVANRDEPAFAEWIKDGDNGYLCDIESPKDWARGFQEAAKIAEDTRKANAKDTHALAGQKKIYGEYIRRIKTLVKDRNEQKERKAA